MTKPEDTRPKQADLMISGPHVRLICLVLAFTVGLSIVSNVYYLWDVVDARLEEEDLECGPDPINSSI